MTSNRQAASSAQPTPFRRSTGRIMTVALSTGMALGAAGLAMATSIYPAPGTSYDPPTPRVVVSNNPIFKDPISPMPVMRRSTSGPTGVFSPIFRDPGPQGTSAPTGAFVLVDSDPLTYDGAIVYQKQGAAGGLDWSNVPMVNSGSSPAQDPGAAAFGANQAYSMLYNTAGGGTSTGATYDNKKEADAAALAIGGTVIEICVNRWRVNVGSEPTTCKVDFLSTDGGTKSGTPPTEGMFSPVDSLGIWLAFINNMTYNLSSSSSDFMTPDSRMEGGCSSCGGSTPSSSIPSIGLTRKFKTRNNVEGGSFGVSGFASNTDKQISFVETTGGGVRATLSDPNMDNPVTLTPSTTPGVLTDAVGGLVKESHLLDASGNAVSAMASAKYLDVVAHDGQVSRFEVIATADSSVANAGPTNGLLAQWNFDGLASSSTTVPDATGNAAHTATFPQMPTFVAGRTGQAGDYALNFNGTNQAVVIGNPADLNFTGLITMSAWIKPTRTAGWNTILAHGYTTSPQAQCSMEIINGNLLVGAWPGSRPAQVALPANAATTWTHVVSTYDGANWNVYVNGVLKASAADATGARQVAANWVIGGGTMVNDKRFFQGAIDDVRIYNRALTSAEVAGLTAGTDPDATGLLSKWGMNEGSTQTDGTTTRQIADATGSAAHAGVLVPSLPTLVPGRTGQPGDTALHFDGNSFLSIGNPTDLNLSGKVTMTAWVKVEAADAYRSVLSHGYTTGPNAYDYLYFYNGAVYGGSWDGNTYWAGAYPPANGIDGSRWMHVAAEYDGSRWRMYLDGAFVGVTGSGVGALPVNAAWMIGAATQNQDQRNFKGSIDDVRIYNRALSDQEIYALGGGQKAYAGRLASIKDPRGYGVDVTYKYNPSNPDHAQAISESPDRQFQVDKTTDAKGNATTFTYAPAQVAGKWVVSQASFSDGQHANYEYADGMHLTKATHSSGDVSTYTFGADPVSKTTTLAVDEALAGGARKKFTAHLTNQMVVAGGSTLNTAQMWNQSALMCRMTKNGAGEVAYMNFHDANQANPNIQTIYSGGKIKAMNGEWSSQHYQAGAVIKTLTGGALTVQGAPEPYYASTQFTNYPAQSQTGAYPQMYHADGTHETIAYDPKNFPVSKIHTDGTSEVIAYDTNHNITQHTDNAGRPVLAVYSAQNTVQTRTYGNPGVRSTGQFARFLLSLAIPSADAGTTTYAYYPAGDPNQFLLQSETDPNGNTTNYTYDANHHLLTKTLPADVAGGPRAVYAYEYDSAGHLTKSTDPVGRYVQYTYDARNRVIRKDYCGVSYEETVYGTDVDAGHVIATRDRDGSWTQYRYDSANRVVKTITGIGSKADATNLTFQPDSAYYAVTDTVYLPGSSNVAWTLRDGKWTTYQYDYRGRQISQTSYSGQTTSTGELVGLNTSTVYVENKVFQTTDPFGCNTYYAYRASDSGRIRSVREAIPGAVQVGGAAPTTYAQILALPRSSTTVNAPYVIEDYELDAAGLQTAMVDARGIRSETQYDTCGRVLAQIIAKGTPVEAHVQTIYDAVGNVIEQDSARYFDANDATGYQKSKTQMAYSGRNLLLAKVEAPGTLEEAATTYTYYLDGKQATTTLPNGNATGGNPATQTVAQMNRPLCGWSLGSIDQLGNGAITDTTIGGDVIHIIQVKNLQSLTTTTSAGLVVPSFLNEVSMDVPDASTIAESTTQYDTRHRPIASTVWSGALGAVYRDDAPIWFNNQVQGGSHALSAVPSGVTGQTTLYYYSANSGTGTLTHAFGPAINLQPTLQKLAAVGGSQILAAYTSASATINPAGEIRVSIQDGMGRTVLSAMLDKTTYAPVTWNLAINDLMDETGTYRETSSQTALGNTSTVRTDGLGRTIQSIDALGNINTAQYDNDGNLTQSRDPNGVGQNCTYDQQNRPITCTDTAGSTHTTKYSVGGLMLNQQDAKSVWNTVDAIYDARGRVVQTGTRLTGDLTTRTYDANGNNLTLTDGEGKVTTYQYDPRNRRIAWTFPGQTSTTRGAAGYDTVQYQYDEAARLVKFLRQDGSEDDTTYNFNGTVASKTFVKADGTTESVDVYTYDLNNRPLTASKGRYGNTVAFAYDGIGRKTQESLAVGGTTYTTQYGYDADSRLISTTYPSGKVAAKTYTARNQLATVQFNGQNIVTGMAYDNGGRETNRTLGNGASQARTYNLDNTVGTMATTLPTGADAASSLNYNYDANKNLTAETFAGGVTTPFSATMTQDVKDRLTGESRTNGAAQSWNLTKEGDWASDTTNGTTETRTHNDNHQIIGLSSTTNVPTYDAQGDLQTDEQARTYAWDQEKNLVGITGGTTNATGFTYDALGRRVSKTSGGVATAYVSAGSQEIAEYVNGALAREHVYGTYVDENIATNDATNGLQFRVMDRRYSTTALLDSTGAVVERYVYDAYGKTTALNAGGVATGVAPLTEILWTGRRLDGETGNYYFRSRYFSTTLGRFISRDVDYLDGRNLYEGCFCEHEGMDPSGLFDEAGHFYTTYAVAIAAGLSQKDAFELAYYSQYPDQNPMYDAMGAFNHSPYESSYNNFFHMWRIQYNLHSLTGGDPVERRKYLDCLLKSEEFSAKEKGVLIHAYGDSYAHTYRDFWGDEKSYTRYGWGHFFDGHEPDHISSDPQKYIEYIQSLYINLSHNKSFVHGPLKPEILKKIMAHVREYKNLDVMPLTSAVLGKFDILPVDDQITRYEINQLILDGGYSGKFRPETPEITGKTIDSMIFTWDEMNILIMKMEDGVKGCKCPARK